MRSLLLLPLLPPAAPLFWALCGALLLRRRPAIGRALVFAGLALAWLSSLDGVAAPLTRWYAQPLASSTVQQLTRNWQASDSVVLVLGGGVRDGLHPDGGYDLKPITQQRLRHGVWWARRLHLPLAFSGGVSTQARPGQPAEAMVVQRVLAEEYAMPPAWLEGQSVDTRGNAQFAAERLRALGTRRVLLVTHDVHMPRALLHFRAALPNVEFVPAGLTQAVRPGTSLGEWLPSAEGSTRSHYLAYELLARLVGH
jgi:uncharacterized SAM-binding protein YcdF (DUF218 family)